MPVRDVRELVIALAKQKPGEITYGTSGPGAAGHVNVALLESMAGVRLVPVGTTGATPALNDVIAGHVQLTSVSLSSVCSRSAPARSGCCRSAARSAADPRGPHHGRGGLPGYEAITWFGLFTTGGTPRARSWRSSTPRCSASSPMPDSREVSRALDVPIDGGLAPMRLPISSGRRTARLGKVVRDANFKID